MIRPIIIILFSILTPGLVSAQVADTRDYPRLEDLFVPKSFLILKSTRDYNEAIELAAIARVLLHAGSDDRGYGPNDSLGLSGSESDCRECCFDEYPCYIARGREPDDTAWVSVDFSSAYKGFTEGYYIIILAHGNPDSPFLHEALAQARRHFPDAYLKRTEVYVGCMH